MFIFGHLTKIISFAGMYSANKWPHKILSTVKSVFVFVLCILYSNNNDNKNT